MRISGISQKLYKGHKVIKRAILRPNEQACLLLGIYEDLIPQPTFAIECASSRQPGLKASLVRVDDKGDYRLSYYLQNHSDDECEVIVTEKEV